eukprot:g1741.t1
MWNTLSGMIGGGSGDASGDTSGDAAGARADGGAEAAAAEARRVREARLARFSAPSSGTASAGTAAEAPAAPAVALTPQAAPKSASAEKAKAPAAKSKASRPKPRAMRATASASPTRPRRAVLDTSTKCISFVLQVTLDPTRSSSSFSKSSRLSTASFLPSIATRWGADPARPKPLTMELDDVQEIIQARLELNGGPPLGWVLASLARVHEELHKGESHAPEIDKVLAQINAVLSNWLLTILQVENMFPPAPGYRNGVDELAARLVGTMGSRDDRAAAMLAVEKLCAAGTKSLSNGCDAESVDEFSILRQLLQEIVLGKSSPLRPNKKRKRNDNSSSNSNPLANMITGMGGAAADNPLGAMLAQLRTAGAGGALGAGGMFGSNSPNDVIVRVINNGPYLAVQSTLFDICQYKGALEHVLMACASWSNDDGSGISTGALLEHRTILGSLLSFGSTGHPDIPDDLFDQPSSHEEESSSLSTASSANSVDHDAPPEDPDGDEIYGDGPSSTVAAAVQSPPLQRRLNSQERAWLANRQQMYALGISNPPPGHVPSPTDHPLTGVQARQFLFSQPGLMVGANDVAVAIRDFPRPFYTTIQELQAAENRVHAATTNVWDGSARLVTSILKKKMLRP